MCGEREGEGEKERRRKRGSWGVEWEIKRTERTKLRREKCVNDAAALRRNVSNGRQLMPQVSSTVDVTVCQEEHNALWLILMYAANSLGNTLGKIHLLHSSSSAAFIQHEKAFVKY